MNTTSETEDPIEAASKAFQAGIDTEMNFRVIHDAYYARVKGCFFRRGCSREDCLDLVQETFKRVYTGLERFRGDAKLGTWLFRIAENVYRNHRRGPYEPPATTSDEDEPEAPVPPRQEDELRTKEIQEAVRGAIEKLATMQRTCLTLRLYQELSTNEIAEFLGISPNTVSAHLFQARARLRNLLKDEPALEDIVFSHDEDDEDPEGNPKS